MKSKHLGVHLLIPVILTISAFVIAIYLIFIPTLENNLIKEKKEMIRELTQSAISILNQYHHKELEGRFTESEARKLALELIGDLRYGKENKDYFWVTDLTPRMVIHPFRPDLNGKELDQYTDPTGKKLFLEALALVEQSGAGYLDYFWQWKDDASMVVPKLSYVEGFQAWGYIVGTGIYLNDVQEEISRLKTRLALVALAIILIVSGILVYILRMSLGIEKRRKEAEEKLHDSRERYRSLVEASEEGTLLLLEGRITYANPFFCEHFGFPIQEIQNQGFEKLFASRTPEEEYLLEKLKGFTEESLPNLQLEIDGFGRESKRKPVLFSVSKIHIGELFGCIILVKELQTPQRVNKQVGELSEEVQNSLLHMNQELSRIAHKPVNCQWNDTIQKCAEIMKRMGRGVLIVRGPDQELIGYVSDKDLRDRVLASNRNVQEPISTVMTSPLNCIPETAPLFEALVLFNNPAIDYLGLINIEGVLTGIIHPTNLLVLHQNSSAFLLHQIQSIVHPDELIVQGGKVFGLVTALYQSGAKIKNITHLITAVTDGITRRFLELGIERLGPPPVVFAFIAMGSEGRGEQSLATDQDNAIIFSDPEPDKENEVRSYFLELGKLVNNWLHQTGYHNCPGGFMAGNALWSKPISQWKLTFKHWLQDPSPQSAMEAAIFFDLRMVFGADFLVRELQNYVQDLVPKHKVFAYHLAQESLAFKTSSDLKELLTEKTGSGEKAFDIKKVLYPITGFARLYALIHDLEERNTSERLIQLDSRKILPEGLIALSLEAYEFLMRLRFHSQISSLEKGETPDNLIIPKNLSELEFVQLKTILRAISEIQNRIRIDFNLS